MVQSVFFSGDQFLPDGFELIVLSEKLDQTSDGDWLIYLMEKDQMHIHLKIKENKQTVDLQELKAIISTVKRMINEGLAGEEENIKEWFRNRWQNKDKSEYHLEEAWIYQEKDWQKGWIPMLLIKKNETGWKEEFLQLMRSYLDVEFMEVILSSHLMMLVISNHELKLFRENEQDLEDFAQGLYEMLQNEWHEELRIGMHYPSKSLHELVQNGVELLNDENWIKESRFLLFFPWKHYIERFLSQIPMEALKLIGINQWSLDPELHQTVEVFFEENLNMSETARRLYIHRNTLQYRLDKVKQQTGLDVKTFEGAMIVRFILLIQQRIEKLHKHQGEIL